jgi:hypothetical protein
MQVENSQLRFQRPILKVELVESDFVYGLVDSMVITPSSYYYKDISPAIILALIEGVLGYTMVHTTGTRWMYRSTSLLK